jgi:ABC-2 type transport system ATP-binding protein
VTVTALAELRAVEKAYRSLKALDGVDLRIEPGEVVALLGPNGAGKTTAIRVLLGLRRPDHGVARLFGRDPHDVAARVRCGATPQETDLPDTLRVREILEFVRSHYPAPLPRDETLARFGLLELADRQAGGLSGGQRRRLTVALAFAGDPRLVFLDEPSSGLDPPSRRQLWDSVRSFAALGRAILLTTHDLAEAEALASRVVVLEHGRVALAGAPAEIAARTGLRRVRVRAQPLPPLPGVERVMPNGRYVTLLVRDAAAVLRDLVAADANLDEIEIARASLEEALER